jgi:hypothetical protein
MVVGVGDGEWRDQFGVERADRETQLQEVHDVRLDAVGAAVLDHRGRQVGCDDGDALPWK